MYLVEGFSYFLKRQSSSPYCYCSGSPPPIEKEKVIGGIPSLDNEMDEKSSIKSHILKQ
jgi:hypothetical protein